jgi:2'-5' RNA ligase
VKEELLPELHTSIARAVEGIGPFRIHLKGTGVFPDYRRPRVLWIGIEESSGLSAIHEKTEDALARLGFQRETRPFNPHLTAGRIKSPRDIQEVLRGWRGHKGVDFGKIDVSEIHLMKSTLKPTGAEYESLYTIKLNEGGLDGKG